MVDITRESPLINVLEDIHVALEHRAFYLALMGALALPDICAAMETPAIPSRVRYPAWFDIYVAPKYIFGELNLFTGDQCYKFRCAMLHEGSTIGDGPRGFKRVLFLPPEGTRTFMHNVVIDDALVLDLKTFCADITSAVYAWLEVKGATESVIANMRKLIQLHRQGLSKYIRGLPVIG